MTTRAVHTLVTIAGLYPRPIKRHGSALEPPLGRICSINLEPSRCQAANGAWLPCSAPCCDDAWLRGRPRRLGAGLSGPCRRTLPPAPNQRGVSAAGLPAATLSAAQSASRHRTSRAKPAPESGLRAARRPARHHRPRRRRPGARRPDQARRRRRRQAAGRPRPHRRASAQGRLRRRRDFSRCSRPVAAMRADHFADPADARQPRPHDERSRAAQERQRRSGRAAPRADRAIGAKQLRRAIHRRGQSQGGPQGFFDALFGGGTVVNPNGDGAPSGTYRTVCVRTCDGYYFPISYSTRAEPIRRRRARRASGCAPRPRSRSIRIAIRARTWTRRCRPAGQPTRRCRTLSAIARSSSRAARAAGRARAGRTRSRTPTIPPRSRAATSS